LRKKIWKFVFKILGTIVVKDICSCLPISIMEDAFAL